MFRNKGCLTKVEDGGLQHPRLCSRSIRSPKDSRWYAMHNKARISQCSLPTKFRPWPKSQSPIKALRTIPATQDCLTSTRTRKSGTSLSPPKSLLTVSLLEFIDMPHRENSNRGAQLIGSFEYSLIFKIIYFWFWVSKIPIRLRVEMLRVNHTLVIKQAWRDRVGGILAGSKQLQSPLFF